jgi:glutathione S-transferase
MTYELYYWPGIQGRGEFVRLALEEAGAAYVDMARERGPGRGVAAMTKMLTGGGDALTPFAPPFLKDGGVVVSHVANILAYLAPKLGLAPPTDALRVFAHGLQLTVTDFVAEVHDTHHPISNALYYQDQKKEAKARATAFLDHRLPKYLGYFERVLASNPSGGGHPVGAELTYVDLSLFQLAEGLSYAFPNAMAKFAAKYPGLAGLCAGVKARPRIAAYLASPRRVPFNEDGIFRHYPELDRRAK